MLKRNRCVSVSIGGWYFSGLQSQRHRSAAEFADEFSPRATAAVGPPVAVGAADHHRRLATRWGNARRIIVTPLRSRPDRAAGGLPLRAVAVAGGKGVGDLVQDRVADFVDRVEQRQRARKGNRTRAQAAGTESPPRVVELEAPVDQAMLRHQLAREVLSFVEVHQTP